MVQALQNPLRTCAGSKCLIHSGPFSYWDRLEVDRLHTDCSVDSSRGLMYSNPSNSDWSILLMMSSSSGVS